MSKNVVGVAQGTKKSARDWLHVAIAVSVVAVMILYVRSTRAVAEQPTAVPILVDITGAEVIGKHVTWYKDVTAPYTLVEFADYQCPPCGLAQSLIRELIGSSGSKLKFTFRNYPLHSLHPRADAAAVAAEMARAHGKFWQVHDALYSKQTDLSDKTINSILVDAGVAVPPSAIASKDASEVIAEDISDGNKCGVHGTPTFLLCLPDGKVYLLGVLSQASELIK